MFFILVGNVCVINWLCFLIILIVFLNDNMLVVIKFEYLFKLCFIVKLGFKFFSVVNNVELCVNKVGCVFLVLFNLFFLLVNIVFKILKFNVFVVEVKILVVWLLLLNKFCVILIFWVFCFGKIIVVLFIWFIYSFFYCLYNILFFCDFCLFNCRIKSFSIWIIVCFNYSIF